jgi:probable rRNA maturation factor
MKLSLDISVPSPLWRRLPRARPIARETIAAASESQGTVRIDRPDGRASLQTHYDGEVSLCLADDAALRALNLSWRGIDKPTNVLSFPAAAALVDAVDSPSIDGRPSGRPLDRVSCAQRARLQPAVAQESAPVVSLGDIALAYETLAREAEDLGVSLADHYRHLLVHGFLHLIGYDHETDAEAERMEALETKILARLGVGDPYAREVVGG